MQRDTYDALIDFMTEGRRALHVSKSADYATNDVLSNFKRCSSTARNLGIDMTASDYAIFMAAMKLDRIQNLLHSGNAPNNEGIEDSFVDAINYIELAYALNMEGNKK